MPLPSATSPRPDLPLFLLRDPGVDEEKEREDYSLHVFLLSHGVDLTPDTTRAKAATAVRSELAVKFVR